jgi:hypothetical protein
MMQKHSSIIQKKPITEGMGEPATDQGGGKYAIKANFSMSGNWKITVYVRKDGLDVKQDIPIQIK